MTERTCLAIVLAAGEGKRMGSAKPKVMHAIAGRTMLAHVLAAVRDAHVSATAVVVGPDNGSVAAVARSVIAEAGIFIQTERRGTAHAALAARAAMLKGADDVLVIFGDTPLVRAGTITRLRAPLSNGAAIAALGFRPDDPTGYGRFVTEGDQLVAIREHKDASPAERAIGLCNAGLMALRGDVALAILERITDDNVQKEFYLTDAVAVARALGLRTVALETGEDEVLGIDDRVKLAQGEALMQERLRQAALDKGVSMAAPQTVHLSADTKLGRDVVIEPYVVFGPGVVVEEGAVIHSFSHLEGAHVGRNASVGPFARLRPGTRLGVKAKIGNFVEAKAVVIGDGAKANHLAYLGDGSVGADANIGAGTIFCNYDGVGKSRTEVGKGAFIGSNSALVAPVSIGAGAYVATGSVITESVPADALAIARARQVNKPDRAGKLRAQMAGNKGGAAAPRRHKAKSMRSSKIRGKRKEIKQ